MAKRTGNGENCIYGLNDRLLDILLRDNSTGKNILWATAAYGHLGLSYEGDKPVSAFMIREHLGLIKPRVKKTKEEQQSRKRVNAEVFTRSWICNSQNNLIDDAWLGYGGAFNEECGKAWKTNGTPVNFSESGKSWQDYVTDLRLEITCGEAPYLASRYDVVTGEEIAVADRIGLLDRKLRVICENTSDEDDWYFWAVKAYRSIYGYEWQGDNLLLARENLLYTFIDYYVYKFGKGPDEGRLSEIADVISWNIWQMDGLNFVVPGDGTKCVIRNWEKGDIVEFASLLNVNGSFLFDAVAGNPPYQVMDGGAQSSAMPIYDEFVECAKKLSRKYVSLITPARWYVGGKGLDGFRERMLSDTHIRTLIDYSNSADCFPSLGKRSIKGGVSYFLRDADYRGKCLVTSMADGQRTAGSFRYLKEDCCDIFIRDSVGIYILEKIREKNEKPFSSIVSARKPFGMATDFNGFDSERKDNDQCVVYALKRKGYINRGEIGKNYEWVDKYKLFVPEAIGNADVASDKVKPITEGKGTCCTETYLVVGPFENKKTALNCKSYIDTKFFHFLLSLKKISQHTTKKCYGFIPLQDFSEEWNDEKLFDKYDLTEAERVYINNTVWSKKRGKQ